MKRNLLILILAAVALVGCRKHVEPVLVDEFAEKARSDDPDVRYEGVKHLRDGAPKHTEAIPPLIAALSDTDNNVRYAAAEGISRFGSAAAEAVPKLTELLRDPIPMVRAAAAHALATMGIAAAGALPDLTVLATRDADADVKSEAGKAVKTIKQVKLFQQSSSPPAN